MTEGGAAAATQVRDFEVSWTQGEWPGDGQRWLPAVVPGGVHESLFAAGVIGHPYFGLNEHELRWVDEATWWYRAQVVAPPGTLRFEGLDTVAEVWVDGVLLGTTRNQHRPHEFGLPSGVQQELVLRFPPPLDGLLDDDDVRQQAEAIRARQRRVRPHDPPTPQEEIERRVRRVHLRKAAFSWGWDFAPSVTSRGVSGSVSVVHRRRALQALQVRSPDLDAAHGTATLCVSGLLDGGDEIRVAVTAPDGAVVRASQPANGPFRLEIPVENVELWWTHDLGRPALYEVQVTALRGGAVVDTARLVHGFRTLVLDRSPDEEGGRLFRFVLNGVPLFARGANWVPPSMLVASVHDQTVRDLVGLARDAGMTMLRVWGGGVYPSDAFYDSCDELGVLVWQDFMFACYDYPDPTGRLSAETELEAVEQVKRLRHHPCLALWCGENEVQAIHELVNGEAGPGDWGWSLFNDLLPRVVATHDRDTAYWPGSPWGDLPGEPLNGIRDGDRHAWEVWHGLDVGAGGPSFFATSGEAMHFSRFDHDLGRFISEFGIQAAPELATLKRWNPPGVLGLGTAALEQRNKDTPKDKGYALLEHETGLPTDLNEYVDFTMACQAEGLKHGVEHYRRRQPHCGGTLVWQLNDSWPGLSWSVIDFDRVPKAAYWFLQRAYQPLLASFRVDRGHLELWVSNSGRQAVALELTVEIGELDGYPVEQQLLTANAQPGTSTPVWSSPRLPTPTQVAWVSDATGSLPSNRRFFAPLRSLPLRASTVDAVVEERRADTARVRLTSRGYGYMVRVHSDQPGPRFSTNYLDLRDGETAQVEVTDLPPSAQLGVSRYGAAPALLPLPPTPEEEHHALRAERRHPTALGRAR